MPFALGKVIDIIYSMDQLKGSSLEEQKQEISRRLKMVCIGEQKIISQHINEWNGKSLPCSPEVDSLGKKIVPFPMKSVLRSRSRWS